MISSYTVTTLLGVTLSAVVWWFMRRGEKDSLPRLSGNKLALILFGALGGAGIGAKLSFLFAEGLRYQDDPVALLTGHSITGALLGGYLGVEIAKKHLAHRDHTGDFFAICVPLGIAVGRIGCLMRGCCPGNISEHSHWWTFADAAGTPRWPSQHTELAFNALFLAWAISATRKNWCAGNRFHVYLITYGLFRFAHEFARDNAIWLGPLGGYHVVAIALMATGVIGYRKRTRLTP